MLHLHQPAIHIGGCRCSHWHHHCSCCSCTHYHWVAPVVPVLPVIVATSNTSDTINRLAGASS